MKTDHFRFIYGALFLDSLCLYSYFSHKLTLYPYFTIISDFLAILALRYCKSFMAYACTLEGRSKILTNSNIKLVTTKRKPFGYPTYVHVMWVIPSTKGHQPKPVFNAYYFFLVATTKFPKVKRNVSSCFLVGTKKYAL